ncbi:MAG: DUF3866 family protein [Armatimonadetes bacterium]|nr:DUF3866 family protein [Armatimonadota bacterium]
MVSLRRGSVSRVVKERPGAQFLEVALDGGLQRAVCFPELTGACVEGDEVLLNTTAVELALGTGGYHFVVANLTRPERASAGPGHVMKLRYTPLQVRVEAAGEREELRETLSAEASLRGLPVIVLPLHSLLPAAAVAFRETSRGAPLAYLMTDSAALPMAFSDTVAALREKGLLSGTVTSGHAFRGDIEAVGLYDGLLLAATLAGGGAIVTAPGPGIVGTGTTFGTSALEMGQIVNAVAALGGRCIVVPRLSLADPRDRHHGLSHHTVTALTVVALAPATVAFPEGYPELLEETTRKLTAPRADGRPGLTPEHIVTVDASRTREWLRAHDLWPRSMGRTPDEDPALFEAGGAGGVMARTLRR